MGKRLSKIITRTGDNGTTGLSDGSRVAKDDARIEAMGDVDELNSLLGVLLTHDIPEPSRAYLSRIQHELFDLGGELSLPGHTLIKADAIQRLEKNSLKALEAHWITSRQIEAARIAMTRYIKRGGKVWIRIFPDKPVTKKPAETRMGKGKGAPEYWVAVVKPGRVMFEIEGVSEAIAKEAMRLASHKLPIKTKFVARQQVGG